MLLFCLSIALILIVVYYAIRGFTTAEGTAKPYSSALWWVLGSAVFAFAAGVIVDEVRQLRSRVDFYLSWITRPLRLIARLYYLVRPLLT